MTNKKLLTSGLMKAKSFHFGDSFGLLPNPDKVLAKGRNYESLRELMNDPHLWSCVQSRQSVALTKELLLEQNGVDDAIFSKIENLFNGNKKDKLMKAALNASLFGFQNIEIVWQYQNGEYLPNDFEILPQERFAFSLNGETFFLGQDSEGNSWKKVPDYKIITAQHQASFINPYGQSLLSKCYWAVTFKNGALRFWINFMERYGMPLLIGKYNRGATLEESENLANALANMTQDTVIVSPSDIDITLHEANRNSGAALYADLIQHCNNEISKAILSETLTTEMKGGSFAAAETHNKVRNEVSLSDIKIIESCFNQVVEYFIDINFGKQKLYPLVKFE